MEILLLLGSKFWPFIAAAFAVVVGLWGVKRSGRVEGKAEERQRQAEQAIKQAEVRREVENDIRSGSGGSANDRLRDGGWVRRDK